MTAMVTPLCGAVKPGYPEITCTLPFEPAHPVHRMGDGGLAPQWLDAPVSIVPSTDTGKQAEVLRMVQGAKPAQRASTPVRSVRRSVGKRSSVLPRDVQAAEEGIQKASTALEPEWVECAYEVVYALRAQGVIRITADDIWLGTDERGVFTEHSKGMAGLLRRMIREGLLKQVPKEDPDNKRVPTRSNESRLLQVYEIQNP